MSPPSGKWKKYTKTMNNRHMIDYEATLPGDELRAALEIVLERASVWTDAARLHTSQANSPAEALKAAQDARRAYHALNIAQKLASALTEARPTEEEK